MPTTLPPPPDDRVVLTIGRVPALPLRTAAELLAADDPLEAVRALLRADETVLVAIGLASPALAAALRPWVAGGEPGQRRAPLKALAYVLRMATRCTPFGLFAAVGAVDVGPRTTLAASGARSARARLDARLLHALDAAALADPLRRDAVAVVASDLVVTRGERLYVYDARRAQPIPAGSGIAWRMAPLELRQTESVRWVRARCAEPVPLGTLVGELAARLGDPVAASELVAHLLEGGVLAAPRLSTLHRGDGSPGPAVALDGEARAACAAVAALAGCPPAYWRAADVAALEARLQALAPVDGSALHVDAGVQFDGALGADVVRDAVLLARITAAQAAPTALCRLIGRFVERYESADRRVPLLELLHDGFLDDDGPDPRPADPARERKLQHLLLAAVRFGTREVELREADLRALYPDLWTREAAHGCEVAFQLSARDRSAIEAGDYRLCALDAAGSDGVAKTASRVLDVLGPVFARRSAAAVADDAEGDALAADLDYLPLDEKFANLLLRPARHRHAVADAGTALPAGVRRISPADIAIGVDGEHFAAYWNGERLHIDESVVFESAALALPHVRFLARIGKQERVTPRPWDWGGLGTRSPFLPRVRYGRLILAGATWTLPADDLRTAPDLSAAVAAWRADWDVPRYLYLVERDQRLLLDLHAPVSLELLRERLAANAGRLLEFAEMLPAFDDAWLESHDGRYAAEFVATVLPARRTAPRGRARRAAGPADPNVEPSGPYGAWTTVKLYAAPVELDTLVREIAQPLTRALAERGAVERWFFLRYRGSEPHLRLRLRARPGCDVPALVGAQLEPLLRAGRLRRYALDVYQPERERYGGAAGLALAEAAFEADSARCAQALRAGDAPRAQLALRALAPLLAAWSRAFPIADWLAFGALEARAQRGTDWETVKRIEAWLDDAQHAVDPAEAAAFAGLAALDAAGELHCPAVDVLCALVHLHWNRMGLAFEDEPALRILVWHAFSRRAHRAAAAAR